MENEFVAKFFQVIDGEVLLQLFHETSTVMEGAFGLFIGMFIQEFT